MKCFVCGKDAEWKCMQCSELVCDADRLDHDCEALRKEKDE